MAPGVVIVGLGWGVRIQVSAFRTAGWNVVGLVGRRAEATQAAAKQHEVPLACVEDEWAQVMLTRDDVHLVSIVSPPATHVAYVKQALAAGKHVLCEKPFAMNVAEAREMIAAAAAAATATASPARPLTLVDHELRTLQCVQRFRTLVCDESVLGRIRSVSARWSMAASPQPQYNWWSERAQAGGLLNAIGSHWIDLVHTTLDARVQHVHAVLHALQPTKPEAATGEQRAVSADDYCTMTLMATSPHAERPERTFPVAVWLSTGNTNAIDQDVTVYGTKTTIVLDVFAQTVTVRAADRDKSVVETFTDTADAKVTGTHGVAFNVGSVCIARVLEKFVSQGTAPPAGLLATFDDGLRVQQVIDAALASHDQGGARVQVEQ